MIERSEMKGHQMATALWNVQIKDYCLKMNYLGHTYKWNEVAKEINAGLIQTGRLSTYHVSEKG